MTRLPRLEGATELLDAPRHEAAELSQSLGQVAAVNRFLGGRRALLRRLPDVLPAPADRPVTLLDVGTGSGDLPRAIARWAAETHRAVRITASDAHPQMVELARAACAAEPAIEVRHADALALPFDDATFDVALLSMTLHHFDTDERTRALAELARVTRHGVVVGELERSWPAYVGARLLASTVWRGNRLTRHDGPLSVRRAFTTRELADAARAVGLRDVRVTRHPLFRLVLTARP